MPKSKSKPIARVAFSGALPAHPAMLRPCPLVNMRLGAEEPLRLPDTDNSPSAATVLRSEYTVSSDAAGSLVFAEGFNLTGSRLSYTITAGVTGSANGTQHPQYAAFIAEARVARMVAYKVQITYIGAAQEAAGYLSFSEKIGTSDIDTQSLDNLHTGSDHQARSTEEITVFMDYTQTPRWESPSSSVFMQYTFPTALFVATGLPISKPVYRVRVTRFLEYLPIEGALAEGELRHEPHDPGALGAHGELSGASTSVKQKSDGKGFWDRVRSVANAAYHMAQPVMPYVKEKAREFLMANAWKAAPLLLGL